MEGTTLGGWLIERAIATDGDVHVWAVSREDRHARLHIVARGAPASLLYAATADRTIVLRDRHDGRAYVISAEAVRPVKRKSRTPYVVLGVAVLAAAGVAAVALREPRTRCRDCVLEVNGAAVSKAAYRMYASNPYLFPDHESEDKKHAALDLLVMRALLHAGETAPAPDDLAERAARGEYVIGMQRLDLREKLVAAGDPFDDGTAERFAKSLGFATTQALFDEMRIEYVALAAHDRLPDARRWFAEACAKATIVVDPGLQKLLATPYRPCRR